jgi:3-phenylpropionate/cinnamic acid dioxygenase small subunit
MDRTHAEDFLYHEARLLDAGRWRDWQKLFTDDAIYWVPANKTDYDPTLHVSFIYDNMDLLNERLGRLESPVCYAQHPPSTTLHQIGNVMVEESGPDYAKVSSNLALFEFRNNSQRRFYPLQTFPAHCEHHLQLTADGWKIKFKKVTLLNCDGEIFDLTFLL